MSLFSARANGALPLSVVLLAGLVACTDLEQSEPTEPVPIRTWNQVASRGGAISRFPELVEFVHPVRLSNPGMASDTELTDEQLVEAVARAGGRVLIGFKPASAARTRATGIVPGISRDDALRGRSDIEALGAEITMTYRFTSAVEAVIPAGIAPKLRHLPIVDYVEPAFPAFPTQLALQQDTSWGAKKIRAHFVWAGFGVPPTRGEYANITILDTGLDQTHVW